MRKRFAALVGASAFLGAAVFGLTGALGTSGAFGSTAGCATTVQHDLTGVKTDNDNDGTATTATTALLDHGVKVTTPDDASKAYVRFPDAFALSDVTRMGYQTYKYSGSTESIVVPAYEIEVLLSGHANTDADPLPDGWTGPWFTTLVYEPYQAEGNSAVVEDTWQSWDAYQGGAAKWWSTHALTAIPNDQGQATPETWSSILAAYPNAVSDDYYINQGTGNKGAVTAFDDVTFGTSSGCTTHDWAAGAPAATDPSPSTSASTGAVGYPGTLPSASATGTSPATTKPGSGYGTPPAGSAPVAVPSPSPSDSVAATTAAGASDAGTSIGGLALTGPDFIVPAGFGLLLIITGAILFRIARRRRQMTF